MYITLKKVKTVAGLSNSKLISINIVTFSEPDNVYVITIWHTPVNEKIYTIQMFDKKIFFK